MIELLINSYRGRHILKNMLIKDIKARYVGSVLGPLWSVLTPLYYILLYTFVFSTILKVRFSEEGGASSFVIYFLAGLIPWLFFSESVSRGSYAFLENGHIIKKVRFPIEVCVLNTMLSSMVSFIIYLLLYLGYLLLIGHFSINSLLYLPLPFLIQVLLIIGVSLGVGSITVFFRDITQLVPLSLNAFFFLTPIVYPVSVIPENIRWAFYLNPFYWMINIYRSILINGILPDWRQFLYPLLVSVVLFYVGWVIFKRTNEAFKDIL
ncbi:MAG: ABC transporter permease [Thermodesulfovibrionales bacterium]